jgi:hypothetical protein
MPAVVAGMIEESVKCFDPWAILAKWLANGNIVV